MPMADPDFTETESRLQATDSAFTRASSLPRRLGLWSAVAVLVGSTIGSGIFRSPAGIANRLPGPLPLLAIWLTGGLFALCGALTLAEVAGVFPRTGGVYVFIRESWGRLPAFLFGWSELVIIRAAALGAISTTFSEYLVRVLGLVIDLPESGGHFTPAVPAGSFSIAHFGLALVSVLWVYDGWADVSFVGGEVKDPEKNLPRVLIAGTLIIIALYLLANVAY